jgi:hypothetical protein
VIEGPAEFNRFYHEDFMNLPSSSSSVQKNRALLSILVAGTVAGALDLTSAFYFYGRGVPRVIAAGLLGRGVIAQRGSGIYVLGIALHFFIAISAAAFFYAASRKLEFMKTHFVVSGLFFGIGLYLVMTLIVLPLSALHSIGPITRRDIDQGLLIHMLIIGLPIAFFVRKFSK